MKNYNYFIKRFLNSYDEKTKISKFTIEDLIKLDKNKIASTYNTNLAAIRYFYLVCFDINMNKILLTALKIRKRYPTVISKKQFTKKEETIVLNKV